MNKLIVISGCSGGGKSTLLEQFKIAGFSVIPEVGREIVKEQIAANSDLTPWNDPKGFCELAIERSKKCYQKAKDLSNTKYQLVFFDRSIVDAVSFYQTLEIPNHDKYNSLIWKLKYFSDVFLAPPWKEIFQADAERKHSFTDAVSEYNRLLKFYPQCGYTIHILPKTSVDGRVNFILSTLQVDREIHR